VFDPTLGLYSDTAFTAALPAQTDLLAAVTDVVVGRRPLSDWDSVLNTWRSKAGDKMRAEYQDLIQKLGGTK
jgi:putative aldouronate transport system substrate-binding protein